MLVPFDFFLMVLGVIDYSWDWKRDFKCLGSSNSSSDKSLSSLEYSLTSFFMNIHYSQFKKENIQKYNQYIGK